MMSAPGYSADGTQAALYFSARFADLAGYGSYFLLEQDHGYWRIIETYDLWIS